MRRGVTAAVPILVAVALALLIGAVLTLISGSNPIVAFSAIVDGSFGAAGWKATLAVAIPTVLCAFAVAVPLRGGFVNLGGEGQIVAGGISVVLVAALLGDLPAAVALPLAVLAAAIAGAVVGVVPALLQVGLGVPLLVSSLLLSYPVVALASYLVRFPLLDPATGLPQTRVLPEGFHAPVWLPVVLVVLVAAVVIGQDRFTTAGYERRMAGFNRAFVTYSGVGVDGIAVRAMAGGGALAGLAGGLLVTAFPYRFVDGSLIAPGFVWTGLLAAMLARANPIGAIVAATLFSALSIGGAAMERETYVPRELSLILQALVIVVLAGALALSARRNRKVA